MEESIHKLRSRNTDIFWKSICGRVGTRKNRVTEDNSKVTCSDCLKIIMKVLE